MRRHIRQGCFVKRMAEPESLVHGSGRKLDHRPRGRVPIEFDGTLRLWASDRHGPCNHTVDLCHESMTGGKSIRGVFDRLVGRPELQPTLSVNRVSLVNKVGEIRHVVVRPKGSNKDFGGNGRFGRKCSQGFTSGRPT